MLLQKLAEYSQRQASQGEDPLPSFYEMVPARYFIGLNSEGSYLGMTDTANPKDRATKRGVQRPLPRVKRSGTKAPPLLLADRADYTLGYVREGVPAQTVKDRHDAYITLTRKCLAATHEPEVQAILNFLENAPLEQLSKDNDLEPASFDPGATITFQVEGRIVVDQRKVQDFWARINLPDAADAQCLVCNRNRPPLKRLKSAIKGIPGGDPTGTNLISANNNAFESYGLEASLIAPTCAQCAEDFTQGLNGLLSRESSRIRTPDSVSVFWTREEQQFDLHTILDNPEPQMVQALLESVYSGRWTELDESAFYALSLSASKARAVVRDWLDTTVKSTKENLVLWFNRQHIVPVGTNENRYYGLMALARSTVLEPKDLPITIPRQLLRTACTGAPLPWSLLHQAIRRCHAEQKVTRPRAALIKLTLLSNLQPPAKENYMVELDPGNADPAYLCGVLLALLEQAQRAAVPGIATTVVDRFYATASTAPQAVLPRLMKGVQPHLSKLERDNRGAYMRLQQQLETVLSAIAPERNFPKTLTLEQQGLFALGYYHKRAEASRNIREAQQRRSGGQDTQETSVDAAPENDSDNRLF